MGGLCLQVLTSLHLASHSEQQIQERSRNSEGAIAKVNAQSLCGLISEVASQHHCRSFCLLEMGPAHSQGEGVTGSRSTRRQGSPGGSLEAPHHSAFPKQTHNPEMLVLYKNSTTLSFTAGTNHFIMNTRVYYYALGFLHGTLQETQV